jgi:ferric-dicitrate binding protein FerR (iron transport regulator)
MTDRNDWQMSGAEARAREAVRELHVPRAGAAFRTLLRDSFVTGAFPAPARPIVPLPWYRRIGVWVAVPAAAAAALAVALVLNRGPAWEMAPMPGEGVVVVDGRPIPLNHADDLARALRPGAKVVVPEDSEMRLASAGTMVLVATGGTAFEVPSTPGRWFGREMRAGIDHGTVRILTHAGFGGARLMVHTPEAEVAVTGTTLAIICEPAGTCVCVLEGEVRMGARGGEMEPVEGGMRKLMFSDGRAPEVAEMRPMEREKLGMFREEARGKP